MQNRINGGRHQGNYSLIEGNPNAPIDCQNRAGAVLRLCILLICNGIAGPEKAAFRYVVITLAMLALTVGYRIVRRFR